MEQRISEALSRVQARGDGGTHKKWDWKGGHQSEHTVAREQSGFGDP